MESLAHFDFSEKIVLGDERVLMRSIETTDFENLLSFSLTEPDIWKYSLVQPIGEAGLKNYIDLAIKGREAKTEYPFIVYDKQFQSYAGSTRFYDIQLSNACLQLGYTWYGKKFQGSGLNKHCKYLLLQFAFETMGMDRVEFRADNDNARSIAAMKSIGCVVEGVLRSNTYKPDGSRRDSIVLSILKKEWEDNLKANLLIRLNAPT